jgi:hypothetical protein
VRLLVVTDGTCPAEELRPVLAVLARATQVTLLAVADTPTAGLGPPEDMLAPAPTAPLSALTDRLTALAVDDGRRACEQLRELFDVEVEMNSECGDLAGVLARHASRCMADLVVVAGWRDHRRLRCAAVAAAQDDTNRPVLLTP